MSNSFECKQRMIEFEQTYHQAKVVIEEIEKKKFQLKDIESEIDRLSIKLQSAEKEYQIMRLRCHATEIYLPSPEKFKVAFDNMLIIHRRTNDAAEEVSKKIESLKNQIEDQNAFRNCCKITIDALEKYYIEICEKMKAHLDSK